MARQASVTVGVGHDLVYVPEFRRLIRPRFLARAYTPDEVAASQQAFDPPAFLALRWAAKEAAYKAICDLSTLRGFSLDGLAAFRDYEVVKRPGTPVPALAFHGGPKRRLESLGAASEVTANLSLTDEHEYVAAFVVISCLSWTSLDSPPASPATPQAQQVAW